MFLMNQQFISATAILFLEGTVCHDMVMSGCAEQCLKSDLSFIRISLHFTDDPQKTRVVQDGKIYANFRSAWICC